MDGFMGLVAVCLGIGMAFAGVVSGNAGALLGGITCVCVGCWVMNRELG